jgi:hypothetical protein
MALMTLTAKICGGDAVMLLRASLVVGFAFHLAASVVMARALAQWVPAAWAWIGGALWVIHPLPVNFALEGMEGCFYVFGLTVALWVYSVRFRPRLASGEVPSYQDFAWLGLAFALCFYGRTEAIVLTGIVSLAVAFALRRGGWFVGLLVEAASFVVAVIPWFVYSHLATGSWFQHSGSMKLLWAAEGAARSHTRVVDALTYLFGGWTSYPVLGIPGGRWVAQRAIVSAICTAALVFVMVKGLGRNETRRTAKEGLVLLFASLATGLVYALFFSEQQYWYKAQPSLVFFVVPYVTVVSAAILGQWTRRRALLTLLLAGGTQVLTLGYRLATLRSYPWQSEVLATQREFERLVPEGEPIGCFNAGIPGYFGGRVVVNLDGLMNNPIYEYYRKWEFDRYLADARINYIADESEALQRGLIFTHQKIPLEVVASAALPGWASGRRYLWRVGNPTQRNEARR